MISQVLTLNPPARRRKLRRGCVRKSADTAPHGFARCSVNVAKELVQKSAVFIHLLFTYRSNMFNSSALCRSDPAHDPLHAG